MPDPGIYVEVLIAAPLDRVWELTQDPALHQRWDLRFTEIHYLPRPDPAQPQRFLYETRIGFGLSVSGTGESLAERVDPALGTTTSALGFASSDWKSLIRAGSGYWKYVPTPAGLRFFTWYDYTVRFGTLGRLADRLAFRPLIGWATAWSFDRLRLWAETGQPPELSLALALIHALARLALAGVWIWHGLVPKLLFRDPDERQMLTDSGISPARIPLTISLIGTAEILFGLLVLITWRRRSVFLLNAGLMVIALATVARRSPRYLRAAFNPVTLNLLVAAVSVVGWLASRSLPSARNCLRRDPRRLTSGA